MVEFRSCVLEGKRRKGFCKCWRVVCVKSGLMDWKKWTWTVALSPWKHCSSTTRACKVNEQEDAYLWKTRLAWFINCVYKRLRPLLSMVFSRGIMAVGGGTKALSFSSSSLWYLVSGDRRRKATLASRTRPAQSELCQDLYFFRSRLLDRRIWCIILI